MSNHKISFITYYSAVSLQAILSSTFFFLLNFVFLFSICIKKWTQMAPMCLPSKNVVNVELFSFLGVHSRSPQLSIVYSGCPRAGCPMPSQHHQNQGLHSAEVKPGNVFHKAAFPEWIQFRVFQRGFLIEDLEGSGEGKVVLQIHRFRGILVRYFSHSRFQTSSLLDFQFQTVHWGCL